MEETTNQTATGGMYTVPPVPEKKPKFEIVDYSDRSFALFGDTKPYANKLGKNDGGLWGSFNKHLTDPRTLEKRPGWIFGLKRRKDVEEFVRQNS